MKEQMREGSGIPECGVLTVRAEEMANSKRIVEIRIDCSQLDNKDVFSKSVSFYIVDKN